MQLQRHRECALQEEIIIGAANTVQRAEYYRSRAETSVPSVNTAHMKARLASVDSPMLDDTAASAVLMAARALMMRPAGVGMGEAPACDSEADAICVKRGAERRIHPFLESTVHTHRYNIYIPTSEASTSKSQVHSFARRESIVTNPNEDRGEQGWG